MAVKKLLNPLIGSALAALSLSACASDPAELNVFAASSTRVLNDALTATTPVLINNGGSASLVEQIHQGAPADLLITASEKTMNKAMDNGDVDKPRVLATNTMVMVVPPGNPAGISSVRDLREEDYFVRCDPSVPCGDIADKIMKDLHLTITPDSNEGQVADAGFVYSTDAAANPDLEVIPIEGAEKYRNKIMGAVVTHTERRDAAEQLLDTLSDDFDETWTQYGFQPAD